MGKSSKGQKLITAALRTLAGKTSKGQKLIIRGSL